MKPLSVAIIGCGSFARGVHLPNLRASGCYHIRALVDPNLAAVQALADTTGAVYATTDVDQVLADPEIEAVFITTPHHLHAEISIRAARAGKHIFCEKPMGLTEAECQAVEAAVRQAGVQYTAGYNRGQAPFTRQARQLLDTLHAPMMVVHRIADWFPYRQGWLLDPSLSGGRLIGEAGHALDMICGLVGQAPVRVYAEGANLVGAGDAETPDSAIITLGFPNGSSGVLFLSSVANNNLMKEEIVVTCANHTLAIYNFERMDIHTPDGSETFTLPQMNKGQLELVTAFAQAIRQALPVPSGLEAALRTSQCTFAAVRAIRTGQVQALHHTPANANA